MFYYSTLQCIPTALRWTDLRTSHARRRQKSPPFLTPTYTLILFIGGMISTRMCVASWERSHDFWIIVKATLTSVACLPCRLAVSERLLHKKIGMYSTVREQYCTVPTVLLGVPTSFYCKFRHLHVGPMSNGQNYLFGWDV